MLFVVVFLCISTFCCWSMLKGSPQQANWQSFEHFNKNRFNISWGSHFSSKWNESLYYANCFCVSNDGNHVFLHNIKNMVPEDFKITKFNSFNGNVSQEVIVDSEFWGKVYCSPSNDIVLLISEKVLAFDYDLIEIWEENFDSDFIDQTAVAVTDSHFYHFSNTGKLYKLFI